MLLKLALGAGETRSYLIAGPTIGFLRSAKASFEGEFEGEEVIVEEQDVKNRFKNDFGLDFGAGVSFPAGKNSVFVEGRYALGLTDVFDDPENPEIRMKTKGIQFMAGITFPLGGK